eukprot:jgi/Ulvmu1/7696/UM038_0128.1
MLAHPTQCMLERLMRSVLIALVLASQSGMDALPHRTQSQMESPALLASVTGRSLMDVPAATDPQRGLSAATALPPVAVVPSAALPVPGRGRSGREPAGWGAPAAGAARGRAHVNITVVRTPTELQHASLSGAQDIEVREHLDLRSLARQINPVRQASAVEILSETLLNFTLLYSDARTRSIRGNCSDPEAAAVLGLSEGEAADLLPLKPRQCLLVLSEPFLMANGGSLWVDSLYLKTLRPLISPDFAFISAGHDSTAQQHSVNSSALYLSNMTLQSEARKSAKGLVLGKTDSSAIITDSVLSDWSGFLSPVRVTAGSVANVRNTVFRNMHLAVEIADVSFIGAVRFENASFANVTLQHGAVVSTTVNDYKEVAPDYGLHYYAEDDAAYDVDVRPLAPGEAGVFGAEFGVDKDVLGDCAYTWAYDHPQPGCPEASLQQVERVRARVQGNSAILGYLPDDYGEDAYGAEDGPADALADTLADGPADGPADSGDYTYVADPAPFSDYTPQSHYQDLVLSMQDPWIQLTRAVLPAIEAPADWPPFVLDPPPAQHNRSSLLPPWRPLPADSPAALLTPLNLTAGPGSGPGVQPQEPGASVRTLIIPVAAAAVAVVMALVAAALWWRRRARLRREPMRKGLQAPGGSGTAGLTLSIKPSWRTARAEFASSTMPYSTDGGQDTSGSERRAWELRSYGGRDSRRDAHSSCTAGERAAFEIQPLGLNARQLGLPKIVAGTQSSDLPLPPALRMTGADSVDDLSKLPHASDVDARAAASGGFGMRLDALAAMPSASTMETAGRVSAVTLASAARSAQRRCSAGLTEPPYGAALYEHTSLALCSQGSTPIGGTIVVPPYPALTTQSSDACTTQSDPCLTRRTAESDPAQGRGGGDALPAWPPESSGPHALGGMATVLHHHPGVEWSGGGGVQAPAGDITASATDVPMSDSRIQSLTRQLDAFSGESLFLDRFELLGREERRRGGQAVVQFARGHSDSADYAIKFFLDREAFRAETALYAACCPSDRPHSAAVLPGQQPRLSAAAGPPPAQGWNKMSDAAAQFLPKLEAVCDGRDGKLVDPRGRPLPPCIVMEKGESLQDWSERAEPDLFTSLSVLSNISTRVADMHDAGYVHRDLKPANVMWLPRENRWTVIDFGCAARIGEVAPLTFTLTYAPPEAVSAAMAGGKGIESTRALDAWSLGVMAFELMTGAPAFRLLTDGRCRVIAMLRGDLPLPWEGELPPAVLRKLGTVRAPIMQLLQRDPARRASMRSFHRACINLVASRATVEEDPPRE